MRRKATITKVTMKVDGEAITKITMKVDGEAIMMATMEVVAMAAMAAMAITISGAAKLMRKPLLQCWPSHEINKGRLVNVMKLSASWIGSML